MFNVTIWRLRRVIRPAGESVGPRYHSSAPWSPMTSQVQDDITCIQDVLASFLFSGRKWRHVVHLYIQSMVSTHPLILTRLKNINSNSKCSAMFCSHVSTHTEFTSENKKNILMLFAFAFISLHQQWKFCSTTTNAGLVMWGMHVFRAEAGNTKLMQRIYCLWMTS